MDEETESTTKYAFINIRDGHIKDAAREQEARTRAIKNSLQRKRRQLELTSQNFVNHTAASGAKRRRDKERDEYLVRLPKRSATFGVQSVDPFESLAVDADKLSRLLRYGSAQHAGEPVFSVNKATEHQELRSVFTVGFQDPALASALCLTLLFAANGNVMDEECVRYNTQTIQYLNERMSKPEEAATSVTIGAVLLLLGVESRLGQRETAQIHLEGARQLLQLCGSFKVHLTHGIRRAIFWQDLFCCVLSDTKRVFDHTLFPELHFARDPFQPGIYTIPDGFASREHIFGDEFLSIVGDISALQHMRDSGNNYPFSSREVEKVDNQQVWIESRLQILESQTEEPLLLCTIPAVYLCGYACFADVWASTLLPSRLSRKLLHLLRCHHAYPWKDHADLLLWLLNMGVVFSTDSAVRLEFIALWHGTHRETLLSLSNSWDLVESHLRKFFYTESIHERCKSFWQKVQAV